VKIFIDANVLVDLIDSNRMNNEKVKKLFSIILNNELFTSCDIVTTIYYLTRKVENNLDYVYHISNLCEIIPFSNNDLFQTIKMMKENIKFKDLEDSIQYFLAQKVDVDFIITNDKKFYSPNIKLLTIDLALKEFI